MIFFSFRFFSGRLFLLYYFCLLFILFWFVYFFSFVYFRVFLLFVHPSLKSSPLHFPRIPNHQNCLSTEAKAVYDSLIEKAELSQENQSQAASTEIVNPLKMLKCGPVVRPRGRGSKSVTLGSLPHVLPIIGSHLPRVSTNL